ncbi:hypothetical protein F5876DRAFT_69675 [Lentinula aff. lateritia]|uniref:Uncharacterized protein n=1 Tax=Lentinula aff. lateritia TaxID=2804960 RepID=A0ACC1TLG6_9AGAR|nr:hypothetical protein F5876DRAFT_69675 [Lentinula aff. lateritia]
MYCNDRPSSPSIYFADSDSESISISSTRYSPAPSFCVPGDGLAQLEGYAPSKEIIAYVVDTIADAVKCPTNAPKKGKRRTTTCLAHFTVFVTNVVARLPLTTPQLLLTVAYVDRAHYRNNAELFASCGAERTLHRIFLGALALALRYLDKQIMIKDIDWQYCTGQFSRAEVGRFDVDFIQIIKCNNKFTDKELSAYSSVMLAVLESAPNHRLRDSSENIPKSPLQTMFANLPALRILIHISTLRLSL